jgi:protein-S-isoprenylcysteine O-methyltransferase Ste14
MHGEGYAYGNWGLVITMVLVALFFILKFVPLQTAPQKRSGGALIAFIVALFAEMYGFPLTIFFISNFTGIEIPLDHISGHLLGDLISYLGLGNGWFLVMAISNLLILAGILIISAGWERVYEAEGEMVTDGIYAHVRHPQYTGIFIVTTGFMIQWPTLSTLILWPFVIMMYVRLAKKEERQMLEKFPERYREYMEVTPRFFPPLFGAFPRMGIHS